MKTRLIQFAALMFCIQWAISANALSLIGGNKDEPLLEVSKAFLTRVTVDDDRLNVEIDIAPGYYLYRSKLSVSADGAQFGTLQLPDGIKKQDQFFGEVETYRGILSYNAAVTNVAKTGPLSVTIHSQGCADIGICYPPHSEVFTVNAVASKTPMANTDIANNSTNTLVENNTNSPLLQSYKAEGKQDLVNNTAPSNGLGLPGTSSTAMSSVSSSPAPSSSLSTLLSINSEDEVLDPEVAFTLDPTNISNGIIPLRWSVREGHYLYKKRFSFELLTPEKASLGAALMAEGVWEEDAFYGKSEVFRDSATVNLPITLPGDITEATLRVGYQGCADIGICYPPIYKELKLVEIAAAANTSSNNAATAGTAVLAASTSPGSAGSASSNSQQNTGVQNEQDRLADSLRGNNRWLTILTFFGMGLLLTFTPCVLPMVPILSSIIVGSGDKIGTSRAFILSLIYVLAMALTYTIAGVLIGLSGENIQATLQHPYVLTAFALLFVVLSLSMFGLYEIQLPAFLQNKLSAVSNRQKGGSYAGVATMGFLSALIVGPCVTAPLVGALIYIGQTGDAVLGGMALFALSMGMGLPLLVIGTTFGKYLPRAGAWMDITKGIFGIMLLGLAIYMLDRVIPTWATMLLSALLLITVSMFMGAFESLPSDAQGWRRVSKGLGYAAVVYGTLLLVGVATGTGTLFRPIQGLTLGAGNASAESSVAHVAFQKVKGLNQLNTILADAKSKNQPVMLDFYADWCISCKEMEAFTFTDPVVAAKMNKAVLLQADVTANDDLDKELLKAFGIFGPPAIILYDAQGTEQKNSRVVGYMPAEQFSAVLDQVY